MKNFNIFLAGIITLAMFACDNPPQSPTPMHVEANQERELVQLSDLNSDSPDSLWMRFFEERGALEFWRQLKSRLGTTSRSKSVQVNFCYHLQPPQVAIVDQANQVAEGVIHYLICHSIDPTYSNIASLRFMVGNIGDRNQRFTSLPTSIGQLSSLKDFSLLCNNLTELPPTISQLTRLEKLDLRYNELEELPAPILKLASLTYLNLEMNKLKKLPEEAIDQLTNLSTLDLSNNPWIERSNLSRLVVDSLISYARSAFPCSLRVLCADYIQKTPDIFNEKPEQEVLPEELWQAKRDTLINQEAWDWNKEHRVVFFKRIGEQEIPFYIQRPACTSGDIKEIFEEFNKKGIDLYLIPQGPLAED